MAKTNPFLVAAILMAGLTTACSQNAATAEDSAESTVETQALEENAAAPAVAETAKTATVVPAVVETAAAAAVPVPKQTGTATLTSLPLKPGQYVRSGTPCNRAANADRLALVSRTGMSLNCTFKKIEKTGATTYRVTSECSDGGAAWGREEGVETSTDIYEIPNDTSFKVKYEGGSENSARYCAQVSAGEM